MTQVKKKSNKLPMHISPKGRTEWAKLWKPDTKFNVDGEFGTKLIMDNADATDIMSMLDRAINFQSVALAWHKDIRDLIIDWCCITHYSHIAK